MLTKLKGKKQILNSIKVKEGNLITIRLQEGVQVKHSITESNKIIVRMHPQWP